MLIFPEAHPEKTFRPKGVAEATGISRNSVGAVLPSFVTMTASG